jgi:AcrR family transcriptional regulator
MTTDSPKPHPSLRLQKQQVTVDALIDAAGRAMIEHGLDVTVEDIAVVAGVGRRTVFRHFATREDLLHEALDRSFANYVRALPAYGGGDWLAWITELALVSHRGVASAGRLLWDLRTRRLPARLVEQPDRLQKVFHGVAETLWQASGGDGAAPRELRQAVAAHLSPMFTQAVLLDADGTPELAAELATSAIAATLRDLHRA